MMFRFYRVFLLVSVALALSACSATPIRRSFKEGTKDTTIATRVNWKLTTDSIVKKRNFNVDVWRGVVTLTGRVTSTEESARAEQLVLQVRGVRGVDNFLRVIDDYKPEAVAKREAEDDWAPVGRNEKAPKVVASKVLSSAAKPKVAPAASKSVENKVVQKVGNPQINSQTGVPDESRQMSATRSRFDRPDSAQIREEDLTSEEALASEAAEELKKLRGEEDL